MRGRGKNPVKKKKNEMNRDRECGGEVKFGKKKK